MREFIKIAKKLIEISEELLKLSDERRKRLTNREIINMLLPVAKEYIPKLREIELTGIDYSGHPYEEFSVALPDGGYCYVRITEYIGGRVLEVYMHLTGRFETAAILYQEGNDVLEFAKELRGKGHGFYATLDFDGNIIKSEWD
ncbi:MAG: hypothetical protein QXJ20_03020 [Candidatus Aenigmatarchaeota archaeon]